MPVELNGRQSATETPRPHNAASGVARRTVGICLLLVVVVLWTASNFLASTIFADNTYSKPFFVTYINTSLFTLPLFSIIIGRIWRLWRSNKFARIDSLSSLLRHIDSHDPKAVEIEEQSISRTTTFSREDELDDSFRDQDASGLVEEQYEHDHGHSKLGLRATAKLSFQFCLLWFLANYFAMACLQYTTVGSTTILTSTSGVWTLIFGAVIGVEKFTLRKFCGTIASLIGVILISRVDLSSSTPSDDTTGSGNGDGTIPSFPHKTPFEIALGDAMAAFSAVLYGIYTIVMKKQVGDESRVNMQLFFGLVGLFNLLFLWPGLVILHLTGLETFALPGSHEIWVIILVNALTSLISDICWAYAMLLTTPLLVTVGLSLTIPLSLVGEMILQSYYATPLYWVGATIVFLSFMVVNHESRESATDSHGVKRLAGGYEVVPGRDEESNVD